MEIKIGEYQGKVIRDLFEKRKYYDERKSKLFRLYRRDLITKNEYEKEYFKANYELSEILSMIADLVACNL